MNTTFPKTELNSWLRHAAAHDQLDRVKQCIADGANPYAADEDGKTAFNHAASNGLNALKYLTECAFEDTQKKSDRRWPDMQLNTPSGKYGSTLITYACKVCDAETVKKMFEAGANDTIVNGSGWNLLHATAVMPGRKEVLQLLKERLGIDALRAQTTHEYKTDYNKNAVTFAVGLTPAELCHARIEQDKHCPKELHDYLEILSPRLQVIPTPGDKPLV